jgi:hypothetical protein
MKEHFSFFLRSPCMKCESQIWQIKGLVPLRFIKQNGHCRYKYIVLWRDRSYFVKKKRKHSDFTKLFSETDIINMIEIFIDNIFAMFGGQSVYIYGCKMCSFSRRFVLLLAWFWLHTGASQEKRKVFFH